MLAVVETMHALAWIVEARNLRKEHEQVINQTNSRSEKSMKRSSIDHIHDYSSEVILFAQICKRDAINCTAPDGVRDPRNHARAEATELPNTLHMRLNISPGS